MGTPRPAPVVWAFFFIPRTTDLEKHPRKGPWNGTQAQVTKSDSQQDHEWRHLCPCHQAQGPSAWRYWDLFSHLQMCPDQMSPTFRKFPALSSPLTLPVPYHLPRKTPLSWASPSGHQECPKSHFSFPNTPIWISSVHLVEGDGGKPRAAHMGLQACFTDRKPDRSTPHLGISGEVVRMCGVQ